MNAIHAKVGVTNVSGNTGKTTITKNVLASRLANLLSVVHIETINSTGDVDDLKIASKDLRDLNVQLATMDDDESIVVDFGASNIEDVFDRIASSLGTIVSDIDLWIIPTVNEKKVKVDTVRTAKDLIKIGVPAAKIAILANKVVEGNIEDEFASVIREVEAVGVRFLKSYIPLADVIELASKTIPVMAADDTDYKAEIKKLERDDPRRAELAVQRVNNGSAKQLNKIFDAVFSELFQE